ncbi:MAG: hypothetical protein HGA45_03055 [Chloroflexales bacterium]|nr:hypothetical protein [Chloroflexales bacterium]
MESVRQAQPNGVRVMWLAVGLALVAALSYVLMALHILGVGDLATAETPATIVFVAAGCYLVGGLLILLRWRWLWVVGAVINALVLFVFFRFYLDRPAVLFSPGGLTSKAAQILLELSLLFLIVTEWRRAHPRQDAATQQPRALSR